MHRVTHVRCRVLVIACAALAVAACSSAEDGQGGATSPTSADFTATTGGRPSSVSVASTSAAPATITATRTVHDARPTTPAASLPDIIRSGSPVDPEPYMGAHANAFFVSPTKNIGCFVVADGGDYVQCTITHYDFPQPGRDCDNGAIVEIDVNGLPGFDSCAPERLTPEGYLVLPYGRSLTNGKFTCASKLTGVYCMQDLTETGFALSIQKFTVYR